jgi:hypothetical protein
MKKGNLYRSNMENIGRNCPDLNPNYFICKQLRTYVCFCNIDVLRGFYTLFMSMIRASNSSLGTIDLFLIRVL